MTFKIESITVLVPKFQYLLCLFCSLIFDNDILNIKTSEIDSLAHYKKLVTIDHIRIAFAVPKDMWIVRDIKCFYFLIIFKIPKNKSVLLFILSHLNAYFIDRIACSYLFDLALSLSRWNNQWELIEPLVWISDVHVPHVECVKEENILGIHC